MKAYDIAKILYPALNKNDFISLSCPDKLYICENLTCLKDKTCVDEECIKCWNQEVPQERVNFLMESKKMCELMGCWD